MLTLHGHAMIGDNLARTQDTKRDVSEMFLKDNLVLLGNLPRNGSPLAILQCADRLERDE